MVPDYIKASISEDQAKEWLAQLQGKLNMPTSGPQGPQGPLGPQGPQGPLGPQAPQGESYSRALYGVLRKALRDPTERKKVLQFAEDANIPLLAGWLTFGCSHPYIKTLSESTLEMAGVTRKDNPYFDLWVHVFCGYSRLLLLDRDRVERVMKVTKKSNPNMREHYSNAFYELGLTDAYTDMMLRRSTWEHMPSLIAQAQMVSPLMHLADFLKKYPALESFRPLEVYRKEGKIELPSEEGFRGQEDEEWVLHALQALNQHRSDKAGVILEEGRKKFLASNNNHV